MSIEEIMAQSQTPRTHSIWNALVNAGSNPVETGRILGAARKMELELKAANDRIKRLEDIINRAHLAFFSDSSDRKVSIAMHRILDEEVRKEAKP